MITTDWEVYSNGNCTVHINRNDGTKIREWEGEAHATFPESIDLKITDYCDAGCFYCHEKSTKRGLHADLDSIYQVVDGLPRGVEIAIGGGNPLSHPQLLQILHNMKDRGLLPNLTINQKHILKEVEFLKMLQKNKLVYGIGISITEPDESMFRAAEELNNVVWHVIVGIADLGKVMKNIQRMKKILILGYRVFGFGAKYNADRIESEIKKWQFFIGSMMRSGSVISFDNLGLKQLQLKSKVPVEVWDKHFMGKDGMFTMYADAVARSYAISSTSERNQFGTQSIEQMFANVRNLSMSRLEVIQ